MTMIARFLKRIAAIAFKRMPESEDDYDARQY
jgi:hypothetical protein